ncbi:hypothetical protein N431DRAFT_480143 [Stipitochalara longipes BDJ]|nr:hypothetical protein N431DRAFT_480143 [Stipitochalara longipes BDJ]
MSGNNSEYCTQCQGPKGNEANNQLANHYGVRYACPRCQTRFEKTRRQDEEYVKEATKDARNLSNMSQEWKDWIHAEGMSGRFKAKLLELRRAGYTARQAVDAFKWGAIWESLPSNVNPNNYGITEYSEGYYNSAYPGREWQPQFAYEPAEASSPAPMLDNRHATQGNLQYSSYSIPPAGASTSTQIRQTTENNTSHQKYYLHQLVMPIFISNDTVEVHLAIRPAQAHAMCHHTNPLQTHESAQLTIVLYE